MRFHLVSVTLALAVSLLILGLARLVLPACGVETAFPGWLRFCPLPQAAADPDLLASLDAERSALENRIALLQRDLGEFPCEPTEPTRADRPAEAIDPDRWTDRDLTLLDGCWELDSDYATRDPDSGEVTSYDAWSICFPGGSGGTGRQVMRSSGGALCEGTVSASFAGDGRLVLTEPGNLQCSDGYFIYRRDTTCELASDGRLQCASVQPEVGGRGSVVMRPAQ